MSADQRTFDPVANATAHRCVHGHAPPCLFCVIVGFQAATLRRAFSGYRDPRDPNDTRPRYSPFRKPAR